MSPLIREGTFNAKPMAVNFVSFVDYNAVPFPSEAGQSRCPNRGKSLNG